MQKLTNQNTQFVHDLVTFLIQIIMGELGGRGSGPNKFDYVSPVYTIRRNLKFYATRSYSITSLHPMTYLITQERWIFIQLTLLVFQTFLSITTRRIKNSRLYKTCCLNAKRPKIAWCFFGQRIESQSINFSNYNLVNNIFFRE